MSANFQVSVLRILLLGFCLAAAPALADDFVVNAPSTATNGGNVLNGNDNLAVTDSGSIATAGTPAVNLTGTGNTVMNNGSVSTVGNNTRGIVTVDGNTITNSGMLTTSGVNSDGIRFDDSNVITNSGFIGTTGDNSFGMYGVVGSTLNFILNSGTITTSGDGSVGIAAYDNNTITNTGAINTTGADANGIAVNDGNSVTNIGTITTTGVDAYGIVGNDGNTVVNAGDIATAGVDAYGIYVNDGNMVTNNGSIITSGNDGYGIIADDGNTVINNGLIRVLGDASVDIDGIEVDNNNTVINRGLIETFGFGSDGIDADDNNIVRNSGRILVHGTDAEAIDVDNNSTITNSGSLVSVLGNSIEVNGTGNTLNLLAPSFLGGAIDFGANTTTVNITTGRSQSLAWSLPTASLVGAAPNVSGPLPFVYNGAVFATVDPTVLTSIYDAMGQRSTLLFDLMRMRRNRRSVGDAGNDSALAYAPERKTTAADVIDASFGALPDDGPRYWAETFGAVGQVNATGIFNQQLLAHGGAAVGVDVEIDAQLTAGVMAGYLAGYAHGMAPFSSSFENTTHTGFAGIYGRWQNDGFFVDVATAVGAAAHADKRLVNNNLAPLGISWASANYASAWIAPEVAAGFSYQLNDLWVATPSVRLRGAAEWLGGYAETGSVANITVPARMAGFGEVAFEYGVKGIFGETVVDLTAGYAYRAMLGNGTTAVSLLGQTLALPSLPGNQHLVYASADFSKPLISELRI